jgi:hypothetical protein
MLDIESCVLGAAHEQQPHRQKAENEHGKSHGNPAGTPVVLADREMCDERERNQSGQLRNRGDRRGPGTPRDEPVVQCAVQPRSNGPAQFMRAKQNRT